ncbi:hypothetical protein GCM10023333_41210 [Ferrimonas pelagia]|uniref:Radical SAM core domain-containing protein n=1 Tax=Ferrimonas pelagia TaxID=1177826 RepID=A0ABP9FI40_9GAMM
MVTEIGQHAMLLDGVTFSGGEATLQHRFLAQVFTALRREPNCEHLSVLLDSNGLLSERHWPELLRQCDGVMLDIKALDNGLHRQLTGRSNVRVLDSARQLAQANKLMELRWLVIQDVNDTAAELEGLIELIRGFPHPVPLRLNGYRHHGVRQQGKQWPETTEHRLSELIAYLRAQGIEAYSGQL